MTTMSLLALVLLASSSLSASPTPETLIAGFREADGAGVSVVSPEPPPEGAVFTAHVTPGGAVTIRQTLGKKKLDRLVIAPDPKKKGKLDHEIFVAVTKRDAAGEATKLFCSGYVTNSTRWEPTMFLSCYPNAELKGYGREITQMALTLERTTLDIGEGPLHYRAPRAAAMVAANQAWWRRITQRVKDKQTLPLGAHVAPVETDKWAVLPDVSARVAADVDALAITIDYSGKKTPASYRLVALEDWVSFADERLLALRLDAPGSKTVRVCPLVPTEAAKKPFDMRGPSFTLVGPCYSGLTKELFREAKSDGVGLSVELPKVTRDGWVHLKVSDDRLLVLTAPAPSEHPNAWVRVDSSK
jgi:hypothetical protein